MDFGLLRGYGEHFGSPPGDGPDIGLGQVVGAQNGGAGRIDVVRRVRDLEPQHAGGRKQPVGVVAQAKNVSGVAALALKHGAGIM